MALTFTKFYTFEDVVNHYESIKPLRGAQNAGKDIRPIGDRKRKWERIIKISPNCYALSDGYHPGDTVGFGGINYWHGPDEIVTLKHMEFYAPIVWRRHRDGTVTVKIRNGAGPGNHNGRYNFLYRHTPRGLGFIQTQQGKQYIAVGGLYSSPRLYLAKGRTFPKHHANRVREHAANNPRASYMSRIASWVQTTDDNAALVFKLVGGNWEHVQGTGRSEEAGPRVKKDVKAKFKEHIKKFFGWGMTMSPLLPVEDREYRNTMAKEYTEIMNGLEGITERRWLTIDKKHVRAILKDDEHPARLHLWLFFMQNCTDGWGWSPEYLCKTVETKDDLKKVRSRFNTWVNRTAGFMNK